MKILRTVGVLVFAGIGLGLIALAQTTPAQRLDNVTMDPDGTLHWGPRVIPPNLSASPESRRLFIKKVQDQLALRDTAPKDPEERRKWTHETFTRRQAAITAVAMKVYPNVVRKDTTMAGIPVIVFSAKDMPERNKNRVALEFEIDAEGVELAGIGKMTVISVKYNEGTVTEESHRQIVRVYREVLKTHKPEQIALYGLSGGCQFAATVTAWLPALKLPMPAVLGLITCAGGDGDSRITMNGLDPMLSAFTTARPAAGVGAGNAAATRRPDDPPQRILDTEIPQGFPPAYLISGTRDMALSGTVRLHRKLRHAGVEADLNVFDGMWHSFSQDAELPEAKDAMTDLWRFFDKHMGI